MHPGNIVNFSRYIDCAFVYLIYCLLFFLLFILFYFPHLFEFRRDLWRQRVPALSCGIICVILRLAVLIQYRSVTRDNGIYRACIASRGKNGTRQTHSFY